MQIEPQYVLVIPGRPTRGKAFYHLMATPPPYLSAPLSYSCPVSCYPPGTTESPTYNDPPCATPAAIQRLSGRNTPKSPVPCCCLCLSFSQHVPIGRKKRNICRSSLAQLRNSFLCSSGDNDIEGKKLGSIVIVKPNFNSKRVVICRHYVMRVLFCDYF